VYTCYNYHHHHPTNQACFHPLSLQEAFKIKQKAIKEAAKEEVRLLKLQMKPKYQKE
jgi:hypothetical protein